MDYILHQGASEKEFFNGIRDRDRTPGMTLADFMKLGEVQMAGLSVAQLVAMRLYTSHSFPAINLPLRKQTKPHPLPATVMCISEGLKALRALDAESGTAGGEEETHPRPTNFANIFHFVWPAPKATAERVEKPRKESATVVMEFYRGFTDTQVTGEFRSNGGTEFAPMSTTTEVEVACGYAIRKRETGGALLMKIVTENNLQRGADVRFLSMFPGEAETLFPPLTFMQPTGKEQVIEFELPGGGSFKLCIIEVKTTLP